jgi:predicted DCC family thiol-disulfide oxidoreductase YuxK
LILYDADCRFCRWSLGWVLRWDRRRALVPLPLQDPRAAELLASMSPGERMSSWHLVVAGGRIASAGAGAAPLLRMLPGGRPLAWVCERVPGAAEAAYARVAASRGALGRRLGEASIARADRLIADRRAALRTDRPS